MPAPSHPCDTHYHSCDIINLPLVPGFLSGCPLALYDYTSTIASLFFVLPFRSVSFVLPKDKHLHLILKGEDEQKVRALDKVIVALNVRKEKYLNYETSINGDLIGNKSAHCRDSKELNYFGVLKKIQIMMVNM